MSPRQTKKKTTKPGSQVAVVFIRGKLDGVYSSKDVAEICLKARSIKLSKDVIVEEVRVDDTVRAAMSSLRSAERALGDNIETIVKACPEFDQANAIPDRLFPCCVKCNLTAYQVYPGVLECRTCGDTLEPLKEPNVS